jgi:hypothetical protein
MATNSPASPERSRWVLRVIVVGLAALAMFVWGPMLASQWRFRESALRGLNPAQVIARLGEPTFASARDRQGTAYYDIEGEPVWGRMSQAGRDELCGRSEFQFGYYAWLGDHVSVRFRDGRVVGVDRSSK